MLQNVMEWFAPDPGRPDPIDYLVTLVSALLMYVFALNRGFGGALAFLRQAFPNRSERFYVWCDLIVVTLGGSFVGFVLYWPVDITRAMAAGFGWMGALNVALRKAESPAAGPAPVLGSGVTNG